MILLALGITMCGTGCSYYKSANNLSQVTESPLVPVDSWQPANTPGVKNDITSNKEEAQSVKLKIAIGETMPWQNWRTVQLHATSCRSCLLSSQ